MIDRSKRANNLVPSLREAKWFSPELRIFFNRLLKSVEDLSSVHEFRK